MGDHDVLGVIVYAPGINQDKSFILPNHTVIVSVPGHSGGGIDQCLAGFGYPVKKFLGAGWEGAVYQAINEAGKDMVIKLFYHHIVEEINYDGVGGIQEKPVVSSRNNLLLLSKWC